VQPKFSTLTREHSFMTSFIRCSINIIAQSNSSRIHNYKVGKRIQLMRIHAAPRLVKKDYARTAEAAPLRALSSLHSVGKAHSHIIHAVSETEFFENGGGRIACLILHFMKRRERSNALRRG